MSRVGKNKIAIPSGVNVSISEGLARTKGPKGELSCRVPDRLILEVQGAEVSVLRKSSDRHSRSLHGTFRSLIQNMVQGVSEGYTRVLELNGVGYRVQVQDRTLVFSLGFSHPVRFELPAGIEASVEKQTALTLKGIDSSLLGQVAANIRNLRPPEPYKGKGIKYAGEVIRRKEGKAGKAR